MEEEPKGGVPESSFTARLGAARKRQGLDPKPAVPGKSDEMSPWGLGARVGVEMVSALVVAVAIGWGLDRWFGTTPIMIGVFVVLGGAAGVLNVWRLVAPKTD